MSSKAHSSSGLSPESLPEDFFDSNKKSKKAQEDDLAKELEQFEKEMAILEKESEDQLNEEFNKLQEDKNIDELDQQLEQWKRIVELEKRAEELQNKTLNESPPKKIKIGSNSANQQYKSDLEQKFTHDVDCGDEDLDNIEDFEDKLLNWRSKRL